MKRALPYILSTLLALSYFLLVRLVYGLDLRSKFWSIMTVGFLFGVPFIGGLLSTLSSRIESVRQNVYNSLFPWLSVALFMVITLVTQLEGWACWLMALPLFLAASTLGGLLGGYLKRTHFDNKIMLSVMVLVPFLISPVERMIGTHAQTYTAYTEIDIDAPAAVIWENVTRVQEIQADQDHGWLTRTLGFPRPLRAELDRNEVGGAREAIFTNGLVFHETVSEYLDQQKMVFTIKAFPYEIPSTTMDEHVVIGGDYFDVIDGTYELEELSDGRQRLHLYSHFMLKTTFNFYASLWARWIMQDIQNNILQIQKARAEGQHSS